MSNIVELTRVAKLYRRGAEEIRAIDDMTLSIQQGDYLSIVGPSGSGKTTLLNLVGCMDRPSEGLVQVHDIEVENLTDNALAAIRSTSIGFVFQNFFLIPTLTALENVMLPARFCRKKVNNLETRARELLELVGLGQRADHLPVELSGGEMQRVAIARALINNPLMLLADEPTGNLDSHRAQEISELFTELNQRGLTILVVTHDPSIADSSLRSIHLKDGRIESDVRRKLPPEPVLLDAHEGHPSELSEVPEYLPLEFKRPHGSVLLTLLTFLLGAGLILSTFLNWYVETTGYQLLSLSNYPRTMFTGNPLMRTVGPNKAFLFTGFWPLFLGAVLIASGILIFLRIRGTRWLLLTASGLATAIASLNLVSIYTELQPGQLGPAFLPLNTRPGPGVWLFLGFALGALGFSILTGWFSLPQARTREPEETETGQPSPA